MILELKAEQRDMLLDLLEVRAKELHSEIRRCMDHTFKDKLRKQLDCCKDMLEHLEGRPSDAD